MTDYCDGVAPSIKLLAAERATKAVVLVLHGGAQQGSNRVRPWSPTYLRMVPFARTAHSAGKAHGVEVGLLRYRVRGWNKPSLDPVRDGRWALARITERHPGVPVLLIGHSMGARVSLRIADDPSVVGVCALAPWTTEEDWVSPVDGVKVVIAHGTEDTVTTPESSYAYAQRASAVASLVRYEMPGEGHAMLRRPGAWARLVRAFVLDSLGQKHDARWLREAWHLPVNSRLRLTL